MLLLVEGMDGVGKTTIAKELSKHLGIEYYGKGLQDLFFVGKEDFDIQFMNVVNKIYYKDDLFINAWLTGLGDIYALRKNFCRDVIIDRGVLSNYVWNYNEKTKPIFYALLSFIHEVNIMAIIMKASTVTRVCRIKKRSEEDFDLTDQRIYQDDYQKFREAASFFDMRHVIIDTENKSIDEVTHEVIAYLKKENQVI